MDNRSMSESLARGIAKGVIDSLKKRPGYSKFDFLEGLSHRRTMKLIRKECKNNSKLAFIGEMNPESSRWTLLWGEWAGTLAKIPANPPVDIIQSYDELGFDFVISDREGAKEKFLYVTLTKHALERVILRSGDWLNTTEKVRQFMNSFIEPLIRFSLSMVEMNPDRDVIEENVIIGRFFFAIVMKKGVNRFKEPARAFKIKTVMPATYEGAEGTRAIENDERVRKKVIDYWPILREEFGLKL